MKISRNTIWSISAIFLVLVCVLGIALESKAPNAHAASWSQVFDDEFDGTSNSAVSSQWQFDQGTGWGNNQVETDTNSTNNIYQDGNGNLVIKPINSNGSWTSGRIETTTDSLAAPAGGELQVTASIQLPNVTGDAAQGYWPAFWMLGSRIRTGDSWPGTGEIDAMESVNGTNVEYGTLHCGVDPGGPCNETAGLDGNTPCTGTTCQAGFHTYSVVVDRSSSPEEIRWYLDGAEFWHVASNNPGMDATTWSNAVDQSFFIILNVAIGGGWPGNPTSATQSGAGMQVAYVRAYTADGSASLLDTTPNPGSTPTTASAPSTTLTGTHYITNRQSNKVLDVTGASIDQGAKIQQSDKVDGQTSQQWTINPTGDGHYFILNVNSDKVLDDTDWSTVPGTQMQQYGQGSTAQADQEWNITPADNGYYYITNVSSGLALDDSAWSTNSGNPIIQWNLGNGQANQEWSF